MGNSVHELRIQVDKIRAQKFKKINVRALYKRLIIFVIINAVFEFGGEKMSICRSFTQRVIAHQEDQLDYMGKDEKSSWFERQGIRRIQHAALMILSPIVASFDTAIGLIAGVIAVTRCGSDSATNSFTISYLGSSKEILSRPFINFVRILNPDAQFPEVKRKRSTTGYESLVNSAVWIHPRGEGLVTEHLGGSIKTLAKNYIQSEYYCNARLSYGLLSVAMVITRLVDLFIGAVAALFSIGSVGCFDSLNNLAARGLQGPTGILFDVFYCILKCLTVNS